MQPIHWKKPPPEEHHNDRRSIVQSSGGGNRKSLDQEQPASLVGIALPAGVIPEIPFWNTGCLKLRCRWKKSEAQHVVPERNIGSIFLSTRQARLYESFLERSAAHAAPATSLSRGQEWILVAREALRCWL
jgi:hypothetical protein